MQASIQSHSLPPCIAVQLFGIDNLPMECKKKCCHKYKKKGKKPCKSCPNH